MFEEVFGKSGLKYDGDTEILIIYKMTPEVEEILMSDENNPFPFDDNGEESDGPFWYAEADSIAPEIVARIGANNLGYRANAYVITGYDGSDEQKYLLSSRLHFRWCGYRSRGVVYACDAK